MLGLSATPAAAGGPTGDDRPARHVEFVCAADAGPASVVEVGGEVAVSALVVGFDGSSAANDALVWALREAHRRRVALQAVMVWAPSGDPQERQWLAAMRSVSELKRALGGELDDAVAAAVERTGHRDVPISSRVLYGHPAKSLIDLSGQDQLLVIGSRGRGAVKGLLLGSVSQACAQYAHGPVIVVRGLTSPGGTGKVVVGVDGSAESIAALRFAAYAAMLRGSPLHVVHVWHATDHAAHGRFGPPPGESAHEQANRTLRDSIRYGLGIAADVEVNSILAQGVVHAVLLDAAAGAELLVVGSRGRGGWTGLLLGSVSLRCITLAPCPVVVVRRSPGELADRQTDHPNDRPDQ
jgi:nucleotide-binding universal stress UspA family protein